VADAGDPHLGELTDNGGPTATRLPQATSPLVDAIPIGSCSAVVTTDQRGGARPTGGGCDIGAVEVGATTDGGTDPDGGAGADTSDGDGSTTDAAEVLGLVSDGLGPDPTGTLPATGAGRLVLLGGIGTALVAAGRLLVGLAARRRA
jgi:hypothetical protein